MSVKASGTWLSAGRTACMAMTCLGFAATAVAQDGDTTARSIAATCAGCHGTSGASVTSLVSLAGMPREELAAKMREFKAGTRQGTLMPQLAKGYTEEQIDLAARWFAAQPSVRR